MYNQSMNTLTKRICYFFLVSFLVGFAVSAIHAAETPTLTKTFGDERFGFAVQYPETWVHEADKQDAHTITFSETLDSLEFVTIGLISFEKENDSFVKFLQSDKAISSKEVKETLFPPSIYKNTTYQEGITEVKTFAGKSLKAHYFKAKFTLENQPQEAWVAVVSKESHESGYLYFYIAPSQTFDKYYPTVKAMFDTWKIKS